MPSSTPYNAKLKAGFDRFADGRDRQIRLTGARIDRWTSDIEGRLLGIGSRHGGDTDTLMRAVDVVLARGIVRGGEIQGEGLREMFDWAWVFQGRVWVDAVPMDYWLRRIVPVKQLATTEAMDWNLDIESKFDLILKGRISRAVAKEIVRKFEFPGPSPAFIDQVLDATSAQDGQSAMSRIRTIAANDLGRLRAQMQQIMSGDFDETKASAVEELSKVIKPILSEDSGLNYKAKRIARTEGVRVAAAAQEEALRPIEDMLKGKEVYTAGDANVREEHAARWGGGKLYLRMSNGRYQAEDGEAYPGPPPYGPNCRCMVRPVLHDELYAEVA